MKHILPLFFALLMATAASAQISVVKFEERASDLSARTNPVEDDNGRKCALVKIETTLQGLVFEPDGLGICSTPDYKTGEVWLYLPPGANRITIKHPQAGVLRDYAYPIPIKAATTYTMQLRHATIETVVTEVQTKDYLKIRPTPKNAEVFVDGDYWGEGSQSKLVDLDKRHTYRIEAPLYHTLEGSVTMNRNDEPTELDLALQPAFGSLRITTNPAGAQVYIDSKRVGSSPYRNDTVASGTYSVRALQEMYAPATQSVTVSDDKPTEVNITLQPNFAEVTLTVEGNAEIWVDGERKGAGRWQGRLQAGSYSVEARKANHRTRQRQLEVQASKPITLALDVPTPIYGKLNVSTTPIDAEIWIDGERKGTSPRYFSSVLIGEHTVELRLEGNGKETRQVRIEEGKEATVEVTLNTKLPTVATAEASGIEGTSFVCGGSITDDGGAPITAKGVCWSISPNPTIAGSHTTDGTGSGTIRSALSNLEPSTTYYVRAYATNRVGTSYGEEKAVRTTEQGDKTFTVKGVSFKMIYVKGGTFTMGCTNEQGSDCDSDERPAHRVTLSDYYIGETEVTQELWQAVMGSNPSVYKGDSKPVESVSWYDCQEFIRKLNQLTGKTFSLPTEAEWEFAARGGTRSRGYKYSGSNNIGDVAWYNGSGGMHPVKGKNPNELGIYDMSGNVWEWCSDWYGSYTSSSQTNPEGPGSGSSRVLRGGSWYSSASSCRVADRSYFSPGSRNYNYGFRVVLLP